MAFANPFRSTYFACLAMAAEMSTGSLAMAQLYKLNPPVSMLVIKVESEYFKKTTGRTSFICEDGELFQKLLKKLVATGEAGSSKQDLLERIKREKLLRSLYYMVV
jgi:hypothetical protein